MKKPRKVKLQNLILYIFQRYNNQHLTETKLQKLLYFCDFAHFEENQKSITGFDYSKNHFGPTINKLPEILREMEKKGTIKIILGKNYYGSPKKNFSILASNIDLEKNFSREELYTVNEINEAYKKLTPSEISKLSHSDMPVLATEDFNQIKYEAVAYREGPDEKVFSPDKVTEDLFGSKKFQNLIQRLTSVVQNSAHATS